MFRKLVVAFAATLLIGIAAVGTASASYNISVTKYCEDAAAPGQPIHFWGSVTSTNPSWYSYAEVKVWDDQTQSYVLQGVPLAGWQVIDFEGWYYPTESPSTNTVTATGYDELGNALATATASATCSVPQIEAICRTPGFWKEHAGTEKPGSTNITQAVINSVGHLEVCGKIIDRTTLMSSQSALEAMCINEGGLVHLGRDLTATALNCVMSGGGPLCDGMSIGDTFKRCNDICAGLEEGDISGCGDVLDCFNNGGVFHDDMCQMGTCGGDPALPCEDDSDCGLTLTGTPITCQPLPNNCHGRDLVNEELGLNFEPPGPAGSSRACNSAKKNNCTIFNCGGAASKGKNR